MPRSFLIKQKGVKKYCRDDYCYPDCVPYCFSDDSPNTPPSPQQLDYEKLYQRGGRDSYPSSDEHQLSTEKDAIMQWKAHYMFEGGTYNGDASLQPSVSQSTPSSPPTPSMFHDNHWITQSTLFPFAFKEFERKARDSGKAVVEDQKDGSKIHCTTCKKQFETTTSLEEHAKTAHARSYTCEYCNKSFSRSWNFQRHVLIHKGEKPHKCDKCPKAFVLAAHLKIHNRIHTGEKPYKCDVCSRGFAQLTNLQRHVLTHTGQKPHKCSYCPKGFVSSSDLRRHVRTHTGEKPYQCEKCPKAFTTSGNLHSHMLTHTGEKPYQCKICKWKFISSSNLRTHCRIHHKRQ